MAWTTPPTFADDTVLSASALNTLSDDVEFVKASIDGPNIPFKWEHFSDSHAAYYAFRKRPGIDYLHVWFEQTTGDDGAVSLEYNSGTMADGNWAVLETWTNVDSSAAPIEAWVDMSALTDGTYYVVAFDVTLTGGALRLYLLEETSYGGPP